jgi:hypothetical protein
MAGKRSPTTRNAEPPRIDDLKVINGIGPAVEKRLNGVGVFTFAQLAALSPADIAAAVAGLSGLSTERIIKQDWIGQARKLAAGLLVNEAQQGILTVSEVPEPLEDHPPAATQQVEPEQSAESAELAVESPASEAQPDVEAPAVAEQIITSSTPVELPLVPVENMHEVESMAEPEMVDLPSEERYQPATFTVELLLDEHDRVYSTRALHVQSGREQTWTGWQETQLVDFLNESAGVNITPEEPVLPGLEESELDSTGAKDSELLTPITESSHLAGTLRVRDVELLRAGSNSRGKLLASNEPFDVRLTLDLTELEVLGTASLNYKASIFGKSRDTGIYAGLIGEAQGTIIPDDTATITVKGNNLSEGLYQLAATVILGLPGMGLTSRSGITATINGGRFQVYEAF